MREKEDNMVCLGDGKDAGYNGYKLHREKRARDGYMDYTMTWSGETLSQIPHYTKELGYGFVANSHDLPPRRVDLAVLQAEDGGVSIMEGGDKFTSILEDGKWISPELSTVFDFGGFIFRADLPAGTWHIQVETGEGEENCLISVDGMHPLKLLEEGFWDAAKQIPIRDPARWEGAVWQYQYVTGRGFVEIAVEPRRPDEKVTVRRISIWAEEPNWIGQERIDKERIGQEQIEWEQIEGKPTGNPVVSVFLLGDSTVKSYIFEEAPMNGWGQIFGRLLDGSRARAVNYSAGGRSYKGMHIEGRLQDLLKQGGPGDLILLQSGHNDEREDPVTGDRARFGRGATPRMYRSLLKDLILPAVRARQMIPILVTPMTRIDGEGADDAVVENSFIRRDFPRLTRETGAELGISVLDLNRRSVEYFRQIGMAGAKAVVMAMEPGETPGKTNGGSYANGNPGDHADGTHYREALSRQYCCMLAEETVERAREGRPDALRLFGLFTRETREAAESGDWRKIFPEVCQDTIIGRPAYYRDQIEKMVELGVMEKNSEGNFRPFAPVTEREFAWGLAMVWELFSDSPENPPEKLGFCPAGSGARENSPILTRERMASLLYDAYLLRFGPGEINKPRYMTDYNKTALSPDDPGYDPNLSAEPSQYYSSRPFEQIQDLDQISAECYEKVERAYKLGIFRSEHGIRRGSTKNGRFLEPKAMVTREKMAKALYFCWVLGQDINVEDHLILGQTWK